MRKFLAVLLMGAILTSSSFAEHNRGWHFGAPGIALASIFGAAVIADAVVASQQPTYAVYQPAPVYYYNTAPAPVYYQPAYTSAPTVVQPTTFSAPAASQTTAPYGILSGGQLRSPYSDFSISVGGLTRGNILYDPHTGQPFMVP